MSEKQKEEILEKVCEALPNMDDFNKGVIVGMAEALKEKTEQAEKKEE